jgi:hypothetical protein
MALDLAEEIAWTAFKAEHKALLLEYRNAPDHAEKERLSDLISDRWDDWKEHHR